jgi:Family of unknown function (DUF6807)
MKKKSSAHFLCFLLPALLLCTSCKPEPEELRLETTENALVIKAGEQELLTYNNAESLLPDSIDPLYRRSAYIHPLCSPGGEVLTAIGPADHLHHYGIWNPWTHTRVKGRRVDFWNLGEGQGTVRFEAFLEQYESKQAAGFRVSHKHICFLEDGGEEVAINEIWKVTISHQQKDRYLLDLSTTLSTPLDSGILLEQYRYGGGLGYRATERWGAGNSTILTSEGKTRPDMDGTGARWTLVEGESSVLQGRSGILFLSHPNNRAHPEPLRMWPPDSQNGKANLFLNITPIRNREWLLEPGKTYELKYRMVVFDGTLTSEEADQYWKDFD